jgi:hypothetical protein
VPNRRLYGKLIDHPANVIWLCYQHHQNGNPPRFTEPQFCRAVGVWPPRSKAWQDEQRRLEA